MHKHLTFEQKITAAYLHYVLELEQQAIAAAFAVNIGRVNEACLVIKQAAVLDKPAYTKGRVATLVTE